jgi:hypothetical protein
MLVHRDEEKDSPRIGNGCSGERLPPAVVAKWNVTAKKLMTRVGTLARKPM